MLIGLVGPVDEAEGDESQDASDGPGGKEDGVLSFGFIPLLGEEGDDGADTADGQSGVEEGEGVDGQIEAGVDCVGFPPGYLRQHILSIS